MVRGTSIVLGAGLIILWLAGLGSGATGWLTWLEIIAALCAFIVAGAIVPERMGPAAVAGWPIALAIGLFALWLGALAVGATGWLAWWTFAFACAFLVLGLVAFGGERTPTPRVTQPRSV